MKPALDLIRKRDNVFEKRGLVCAPVEVVEKRTERGKLFNIGPNTFHLSTSIAPIHYKDEDGKWQEIDLSFRFVETPEGAVYRMDKAAYQCDVFVDRVGWRHTSREGWWRQCELTHVDGVPVAYAGLPRVNDNVVLYDGVTPELDVKVCAYRLKSEKFHKPSRPMTLTWRVTQSEGAGGSFQTETAGWDKRGDRLEMVSELVGETFTERWTGRVSKVADAKSRRKRWAEEPEYPVVVDAAISEDIVATIDDVEGAQSRYIVTYAANLIAAGNFRMGVSAQSYVGGFRFDGGMRWRTLGIPNGASVTAATVSLSVVSKTGTPAVRFYADDVDDAALWSAANLPRGITKTTAYVDWSTAATGAATIDIVGPVGEVLGRAGWASGNDLRIAGIAKGSLRGAPITSSAPGTANRAIVRGYAHANVAQLDVTYTVGAPGKPQFAQQYRMRRV